MYPGAFFFVEVCNYVAIIVDGNSCIEERDRPRFCVTICCEFDCFMAVTDVKSVIHASRFDFRRWVSSISSPAAIMIVSCHSTKSLLPLWPFPIKRNRHLLHLTKFSLRRSVLLSPLSTPRPLGRPLSTFLSGSSPPPAFCYHIEQPFRSRAAATRRAITGELSNLCNPL